MPTMPAKNHQPPRGVRDIGVAASIAAATGRPFRLEMRDGGYSFVFDIAAKEIDTLQEQYFSGELKLAARDVISFQKVLKDAIYAAKRM